MIILERLNPFRTTQTFKISQRQILSPVKRWICHQKKSHFGHLEKQTNKQTKNDPTDVRMKKKIQLKRVQSLHPVSHRRALWSSLCRRQSTLPYGWWGAVFLLSQLFTVLLPAKPNSSLSLSLSPHCMLFITPPPSIFPETLQVAGPLSVSQPFL